jgi:hypothetical protein
MLFTFRIYILHAILSETTAGNVELAAYLDQ